MGGREVSFADALAWAEDGTAPLPTELLNALIHERTDFAPSASSVGGCLRQFTLKKREDWYETPENGLPALFGTAMHSELEKHAPPWVDTEQRLVYTFHFDDLPAPYNAIEFGGTPDFVDMSWDNDAGRIRDYKSKVYLAAGHYITPQHRTQLNVYNYLLYVTYGRGVRDWEVVYFDQTRQPLYLRGPMSEPQRVGRWLHKTLHDWAKAEVEGTLLPPVPQFFDVNPKTQGPVAPCQYCPVRATCIRLYNEEVANGVDGDAAGSAAAGSGGEAVVDSGAGEGRGVST